MEDRLADEPEKLIHSGPELTHLHQRLGSVFEQVQLVDAVAEPENQTAGDDRGNERRENLCGNGRRALQDVLIPLRRFVHHILGHAVDAATSTKS